MYVKVTTAADLGGDDHVRAYVDFTQSGRLARKDQG